MTDHRYRRHFKVGDGVISTTLCLVRQVPKNVSMESHDVRRKRLRSNGGTRKPDVNDVIPDAISRVCPFSKEVLGSCHTVELENAGIMNESVPLENVRGLFCKDRIRNIDFVASRPD